MRAPVAVALLAAVAGAAMFAGCSTDDSSVGADQPGAGPSSTGPPSSTPSTTEATAPSVAPLPEDGAPRVAVTPTGVIVAVTGERGDGSLTVMSPCGRDAVIDPIATWSGAHVVLDPGHGGDEAGAIGPSGLRESDVNLAVARVAQEQLEAAGATVILTRSADYRVTLASRALIATNAGAAAFVSIHHNAGPDHRQSTPGTEVYYQAAGSDAAKRLGGLIYEEVISAFAPYDIEWAAFRDAQVKVRLGRDGDDYYGILRRSHGVPAALAELSYVTNPPEEELLSTPAFQTVEGRAVAAAVLRFLTTDDPGSGFVGPSDRTEPAGPGGGAQGCVDPPL